MEGFGWLVDLAAETGEDCWGQRRRLGGACRLRTLRWGCGGNGVVRTEKRDRNWKGGPKMGPARNAGLRNEPRRRTERERMERKKGGLGNGPRKQRRAEKWTENGPTMDRNGPPLSPFGPRDWASSARTKIAPSR